MKKNRQYIFVRILSSTLLFVFCLVLLAFISYSLIRQYVKRHSVDAEIQKLQEEISLLENENNDLSEFVKYFKTESFIENEARLTLGLAQKDESVLVIPQSPQEEALRSEDAFLETKKKERSNPQRWKDYFLPKE